MFALCTPCTANKKKGERVKKPNISKEVIREKRSFLHEFLRRRQHPIKILGYTSKVLWLLLIPLAKNFVASSFDIQGWIRTYWLDLFTILFIVGIAVFRWLFVFYRIEEDRITTHTGPFGMIRTTIYFSQITAMRVRQGFLYKAVNAATMNIETSAVSLTSNEMKLVISEKSIEEIYRIVSSRSEGEPAFTVMPKKSQMLIFSLFFSSTFSGLILFATVVWQAYRLVGREMEQQVADKVNGEFTKIDSMTLRLSETVPQAVLIVGGLIAGGWLISFVSNLMSNWNFRAMRRGGQIITESGAFQRTRKILNRDKINYFDIRQSLTMKIARISSVHILCAGYSERKKDTAALIPITGNDDMMASLRLLEPELGKQRSQAGTGPGAVARFIIPPIVMSLVPVAGGTVAKLLLKRWEAEITIFMLALTAPLLWLIVVQFFAARYTTVGMTNDTCTLSYCKLYQFHRIVVPVGKITRMDVSQNPFQRMSGTCTLTVYTDSEKRIAHRIGRLRYADVCPMLAQYVDERFAS